MKRSTACAGAAAALWAWTTLGQPCEPGWGEPFANVPRFTSEVRALAVFDDGSGTRLYAGGLITGAGPPACGFMRWEADRWEEVAVIEGVWAGSGTPPGIYFLTVLDIGGGPELFAGGQFSSIDGVPVTGLARWNGRTWSAMGAGFDLQARALAMYDDGSGPALYAAGRFTKSGTTTCHGLARWTGSEWVEVGGGLGTTGFGLSLGVYNLGQGPRLYVGGKFNLPSTTPGEYWRSIVAWDGTSLTGLGNGVAASQNGVMKMLLFDHGFGPQLTVAGSFSLSGLYEAPRVARWTGSGWVQVGTPLPGDDSEYVNSMVVFPGPSGPTLHIGGQFYYTFSSHAARLDNGVWVKLGGGLNSTVRSMITTEEGGSPVLYSSGWFSIAGTSTANCVARWDGQQWAGLEPGSMGLGGSTGHDGQAACVFDDGSGERVFVGGHFRTAGDRVCESIAAWDGREWHPIGGGLTIPPSQIAPGEVDALASFDDGSGPALYATGRFELVDGIPCKSIARWDGAAWTLPGATGLWWLHPTSGTWTVGSGSALVVHDDGSGSALYVGGRFTRADAAPASGIARWNGTAWSGLGDGAGISGFEVISTLASFDEGTGPRLFAGGNFKTIAGVQSYGIARWDGVSWSPVGGGFPPVAAGLPEVSDLAVISSGTGSALLAAGRYGNSASPLTTPLILARWDGHSWTPLTGGSGTVPLSGRIHHVWSFDDGDGPALYVGGTLNIPGTAVPTGILRRRAGVWDIPGGGITDSSSSPFMGVYGTAIRREGDRDILLMTGWFDRAGGVESVGVAEWRGCRVCHPDCNRDGELTLADFPCFQNRFSKADPYADCNADEKLTVADFGCFQTKFVAGCR
ncbi:MAG: GC-type dockerin domain-anchored protein [Phycisphaerales bacterium]